METGLRRVGPWSVVIRVILEVLLGARACPNRPNAPLIGTQKAGPLSTNNASKDFSGAFLSCAPLSLSLSLFVICNLIHHDPKEGSGFRNPFSYDIDINIFLYRDVQGNPKQS